MTQAGLGWVGKDERVLPYPLEGWLVGRVVLVFPEIST